MLRYSRFWHSPLVKRKYFVPTYCSRENSGCASAGHGKSAGLHHTFTITNSRLQLRSTEYNLRIKNSSSSTTFSNLGIPHRLLVFLKARHGFSYRASNVVAVAGRRNQAGSRVPHPSSSEVGSTIEHADQTPCHHRWRTAADETPCTAPLAQH